MKRNTMRLLSMLLALVMLLGAIPFVAADSETAPDLTATASKTEIWSGEQVTLSLDAADVADPWFVVPNSVSWNNGSKGESITVTPTATTTYTATYQIAKPDDLANAVTKNAPVSVTVKTPSLSSITLAGSKTAAINNPITLTVNGANDSELDWHVSKNGATVDNGVFTATAVGTYNVYVVALNKEGTADDITSNTLTITVSNEVEAYTVTMADENFSLNANYPQMTVTVVDNATGKNYTGTKTMSFTSSNTSVVKIKSTTTGTLTLVDEGYSTITVTVTIDGKDYTDTAIVHVGNDGPIVLDQDGESFDDDTVDLDFTVSGPGRNDEVDWTFEVTTYGVSDSKSSPWFTWKNGNTSDKREYDVEEDGPEIGVELVSKKGYGVAKITAYASWGNSDDEKASGTFYVSFYDEVDYTINPKDNVDEFDFDETNMFKSLKKNTTSVTGTSLTTANLADLLDNGTDGYVMLDEGNKAKKNEDVGEISNNNTSKIDKYDPDEENKFEMDKLKYLTFEVDDEGSFIVKYAQYYDVGRYSDYLITGEGTIEIIVGNGTATAKKGDIDYEVSNKGKVTLDEDDFEDFWDEYCDDERITGSKADFGYVIFEYKSSKINGAMYADKKTMKDTYKCHFDYDEDDDSASTDFDLNDVSYEASSTKTNYVDEVDFVCYNDNGTEICDGTVTFTVGTVNEGEKEATTTTGTMSFTDVKTTDWFYDEVLYVYTNNVMNGATLTSFDPNGTLNRAMVVTMLYRVEGEPTISTTSSFSDVKDTAAYYYKAVCWAAKNNIVNGVTTTTFAPNSNITREQLAAILYRYAAYKSKSTTATTPLTGYADNASVSSYATTAMKWAVGSGIITGETTGTLTYLKPQGSATRAQAAAMFQRFLTN